MFPANAHLRWNAPSVRTTPQVELDDNGMQRSVAISLFSIHTQDMQVFCVKCDIMLLNYEEC